MYRIGFDVGGTKTEVALLKVEKNRFEVVYRNRVPTEREKGFSEIIKKIEGLYGEAKSHLPSGVSLDGVGLGLPGTIHPKSYAMLNGNTTAFIGHDLKKEFGRIFSDVKDVICANDANCFALAEVLNGAGLEYEKATSKPVREHLAIGVILGTGCGGGIVCGGRFLEGKNGGAGEIGHSLLVSSGRRCFCGRRGCVEQYISGSALELEYEEVSGLKRGTFAGKDIFERAARGETAARGTIHNYLEYLASFISNMTNIFDPDYFVLGGGVSLQPLIYEGLQDMVKAQLFLPVEPPIIYQNKLGDSAGVVGAALLGLQNR